MKSSSKLMAVLAVMVIAVCSALPARAGDRCSRLGLGVGLLYEKGLDATLSYEYESKYHNAWEFFATAYTKWRTCPSCGHVCHDSLFNYYRTWGGGVAWKPCLSRGRNNHGHLRAGGWVGSNTRKVVGSVTLGYEHDYCLRGGWQLYWQARTEFVIGGKDNFRTGIAVGVMLPM